VIPAGVRIFVCTEPTDMRRGFDRLARTAREQVGHDPQQGGALFVFANRKASRIKILWFERNGCCLLYKRLHRAVFELPAADAGSLSVHVDSAALAKLLGGVPRERIAHSNREK
jgi:transposase